MRRKSCWSIGVSTHVVEIKGGGMRFPIMLDFGGNFEDLVLILNAMQNQ